jgi:hypothetical protein
MSTRDEKHTPGPWEVLETRGSRVRIAVIGPDMEICKRQERHGYVQTEARANAQLIAAAPDLLYALRLVLPWLPRPLHDTDTSAAAKARRVVDAALEKASAS